MHLCTLIPLLSLYSKSYIVTFLRNIVIIACSAVPALSIGQTLEIFETGHQKIIVDGKKDDWPENILIKNLSDPWNKGRSDNTSFFALYDSTFLYFLFEVHDTSMVVNSFEEEFSVDLSDRIELFFSADSSLNDYYCVEIDAEGNVMDYHARYYRVFDLSWNLPGLKTFSKINQNGYIVEGSIPLVSLVEMGIAKTFFLGIFRADYYGDKQSDAYWYSWKDPGTDHPDFHVISAFGIAKFIEDHDK